MGRQWIANLADGTPAGAVGSLAQISPRFNSTFMI